MSSCDPHDPEGELVYPITSKAIASHPALPVEQAVRRALARYLRCATFTVHAGEPDVGELSAPHSFHLARVLNDFPGPSEELMYPSASVAEGAITAHTGGFTPRALADTWDPAACTVWWQIGRSEGTLQVDFWADSVAQRSAIDAALPGLMNPYDDAAGVVLRLSRRYAAAVARCTLLTHQPMDPPDAVWAGERRLSVTVGFEAPLLVLREARAFRPRVDPQTT